MDSLMTFVVGATVLTSIVLAGIVLLKYGNLQVAGRYPLGVFPFVAVLFCSGLDIAIITFPLTEFPIYEAEAEYSFASPIAIEIGFWGFIIWSFYFLTAFYFLCIEPRLKLFEIFWIKVLNNFVVMASCAFGGYILLTSLPSYFPGLPDWSPVVITGIVMIFACYSASDIIFMKWLSVCSMYGFFALIVGMWINSGGDLVLLGQTLGEASEYITNIHRFIIPLGDYHEFYLLWWFAWSIMIGQFMSKFASRTSVRMLFVMMVIFPSIPLTIWFSVLYIYYSGGIEISPAWNLAMMTIGIVFVCNSFDSLIRLYTDSLNLTTERFGRFKFIGGNFAIMVALTAAYALLGLKTEHVGLTVIFIYGVVYFNILRKRRTVFSNLNCPHANEESKQAQAV